jgi:hypothetical protein
MLTTVACAFILGAPAPTVVSTKFHRDERSGAFVAELRVPGFMPGYERIAAVAKDERTFLLYPAFEDGRERDRPTVEQLEAHVAAAERQRQALQDDLVALDKAVAAAKTKKAKTFSFTQRWGTQQVPMSQAADLRADLVESQREAGRRVDEVKKELARARSEAGAGATVLVTGRFTETGTAKVDVLRGPARGAWAPQLVTTLTLELPKAAAAPDVLAAWAEAQAGALGLAALRSPEGAGFARYVAQVSKGAWGAEVGGPGFRPRREPDLYGVMTGLAAVQEALQLDAWRDREDRPGPPVKLAKLEGPHVASHDYDALRKGVEPRLFDAAAAMPADTFALHFTSPEALFTVVDLLDAWGTDLAHALEGHARDRGTKERLFGQLALPRDDFSRLHASRAVEAISIVGHDPFVREGTDLTVILTAKDAGLVRLAAQAARAQAKSKRPDAAEAKETYQGVELLTLRTADRALSSTYAESGRFVFVGSSIAGVKAALDAAAGRAPSAAKSADFKYLRTLFADGEDAFVFLGDAFVRSVVGPRWKIGARRRMACASNLQLIEYARLVAQRERAPATTLEALKARGLLPPALRCAHGGAYALGPEGASCTAHGRLAFLTPLVELPFSEATATEADEYRDFTESYRQYWRTFIDPVGVRVKLGPPIDLETIILPLVDNTIYGQLKELYAGAPSALERQGDSPKAIAAVSSTFSMSRRVQGEVQDFMREARVQGQDPWRWLGDQVSFVVYDGDPLLTVGGDVPLGMLGRRDADFAAVASVVLTSLTLPTALVVKVKDPPAAREAVERLVDSLSLSAASSRGRDRSTVTGYRIADPTRNDPIGVVAMSFLGVTLRLYWAVVGDQLYIASRRWLADEVVARGFVTPKDGKGEPAHVRVRLDHARLKAALVAVQAGWGEDMREACFRNLTDLELVSQASRTPDLVTPVQRALGYAPYCPAGGSYRLAPPGEAACSVHGTPVNPKQPKELPDSTSTAKWLGRLEALDLSLTFTPEGLRTHVVLQPKR